MLRFCIRFCLFVGILVIPLYILQGRFDRAIYTGSDQKPIWVQNVKNESYSYAIGGSSRAENNADVNTIDSLLKIKGINMGYSGSDLAENYLTLLTFLRNGNRLSNYVLQIDDWSLIKPDSAFSYPFHEYFFLTLLNDKEVGDVIRHEDGPGKYYLWKWIPFAKYAEFNYIYPIQKIFVHPHTIYNHTHGTVLLDDQMLDTVALEKRLGPIRHYPNSNSYSYLQKMKELCKENGIRLIMYTAPIYYKYHQCIENKACRSLISSFAKANQLNYFDYTSSAICRNGDLMMNEAHLNRKGTLLFSKLLADSLSNHLK
jgi:hypothetical protein